MQAVDPAEEYFPEAHQEQDLVQFALDVKRSEWAYFANGVGEGKHAVNILRARDLLSAVVRCVLPSGAAIAGSARSPIVFAW